MISRGFSLADNTIEAVDMSEQQLEKRARGYFVGSKAIGRRGDVRKMLEEKVVDRIGKKGKYLVDKLFELIEGVYIVDRLKEVKGKEDIRYYKVPPNLQAIVYALDRVLGKPKQVNLSANFSLSQLLVSNNIKSPNGSGSGNNETVSEEPDIFHSENMGS